MSYISQVTYFPKKTKKTHIFPKKFGKYVTWEICDFPGHIFPNSQRSHISQKSRYLGTIPRYLLTAEPKSCRKRPTNLGLEKRLKMSLLFPARRPRPLKTLPLVFWSRLVLCLSFMRLDISCSRRYKDLATWPTYAKPCIVYTRSISTCVGPL